MTLLASLWAGLLGLGAPAMALPELVSNLHVGGGGGEYPAVDLNGLADGSATSTILNDDAQDSDLVVSNLGESSPGYFGVYHFAWVAAPFVTDGSPRLLTAATFTLTPGQFPAPQVSFARVYADDGGGLPGALLAELANPDLPRDVAGDYTFVALDPVALSPNTRYWVGLGSKVPPPQAAEQRANWNYTLSSASSGPGSMPGGTYVSSDVGQTWRYWTYYRPQFEVRAVDVALLRLDIADAEVVEGDVGVSELRFPVTLSGPSDNPVTVGYRTADGTATVADGDYVPLDGVLTIPAGQTSGTIVVQVAGDSRHEADETVKVTLSDASGATLVDRFARGTIRNDDEAPPDLLASNLGQEIAGSVYSVHDQWYAAPFVTDSGLRTLSSVTFTLTPGQFPEPTISGARVYADNAGRPGALLVELVNPPLPLDVLGDYVFAAATPVTLNPSTTYWVCLGSQVPPPGSADQRAEWWSTLSSYTSGPGSMPDGVYGSSNQGLTWSVAGSGGKMLFSVVASEVSQVRLSIGDAQVAEGDAGTSSLSFSVTLSQTSADPVSVHYQVEDGTATAADGDYSPASSTLMIPAGALAGTITVDVAGDLRYENDETLTVVLSEPEGATLEDDSATGTILNDDPLPGLSIAAVAVDEGDSDLTRVALIVTLSAVSGLSTSVSYTTADGSATLADGDYVPAAGTLTIPPGGLTAALEAMMVVGDTKHEPDETFTLTLSNPANATITDGVSTVTIRNDDLVPTADIADVNADEGDEGTTLFAFAVHLSNATSLPVTIDFATSDGTATIADGDYAEATGTLTIPPGATSYTVEVPVTGDSRYEGDETFTVTLSNPANVVLGRAVATGTIVNDDVYPVATVAPVSALEGDAGTTAFEFQVNLSAPSVLPVTIGYSTVDGTATTVDGDYETGTGPLTIPAGEVGGSFTIQVTGDTKFEAEEAFSVALTAENATLAAPTVTGTIRNDDPVPAMSIADVTLDEGSTGATSFEFAVSLSNASYLDVTVQYATANGTATTSDGDFTTAGGTLTIPAGSLAGTIIVEVAGDAKYELDETFTVALSEPANATIADGSAIGTIQNDDGPPTIAIADLARPEGGAGGTTPIDFTVSISNPSYQTVTVRYGTTDGTALVADNDYTAVTNALVTIPSGSVEAAARVNVKGDTKYEVDETFTVTLSGPVNATIERGVATGTIENDDTAPTVWFTTPTVSVDEGNEGTVTCTFSVRQAFTTGAPTTVEYATEDGTAEAATGDYVPASGTLTIPAGSMTGTIPIQVTGDRLYEQNEQFTLRLLSTAGATLGEPSVATGTILNDDPRVDLAIGSASITEGDVGTRSLVFEVKTIGPIAVPVQVEYTTEPGDARPGSDYTATSGTLVIDPAAPPRLQRSWGPGGSGSPYGFSDPTGIAADRSGNVFVTDQGAHRVYRFTNDGGHDPYWRTDIVGFMAPGIPMAVAVDRSDHVYVVDALGNRIKKYTAAGDSILHWGREGDGDGEFLQPSAVAVDRKGHVFVADAALCRIQKFRVDGTFVKTWGECGTADGKFNAPSALATDASGNVYVGDSGNHRVQKFDGEGNFKAAWSTDFSDGPDAAFGEVLGIAVAGDTIYVTDRDPTGDPRRVHAFRDTVPGIFLARWGARGAGDGEFEVPRGIAVDPYGGIFVLDAGNNRVQKYSGLAPSGVITVECLGDLGPEADEHFQVRLTNPAGAEIAAALGTGTIVNDDAATGLPDLTVTPADLGYDAEKERLTAVVRNIGEADAYGVKVRFTTSAGGSLPDTTISHIAAGQAAAVYRSWTPGAYPDRQVSVTVDPDNVVAEYSDINNGADRTLVGLGRPPVVNGVTPKYGGLVGNAPRPAFGNYRANITNQWETFTADVFDPDGDVVAVRFKLMWCTNEWNHPITCEEQDHVYFDDSSTDRGTLEVDAGTLSLGMWDRNVTVTMETVAIDGSGLESEPYYCDLEVVKLPLWLLLLQDASNICPNPYGGEPNFQIVLDNGYLTITARYSPTQWFCQPLVEGKVPEVPFLKSKDKKGNKVAWSPFVELQIPLGPALPWRGKLRVEKRVELFGTSWGDTAGKPHTGGSISANKSWNIEGDFQISPDGDVDSLVVRGEMGYDVRLPSARFPIVPPLLLYGEIQAMLKTMLGLDVISAENFENWAVNARATAALGAKVGVGFNVGWARLMAYLDAQLAATIGAMMNLTPFDLDPSYSVCTTGDVTVKATVGYRWFSKSWTFWKGRVWEDCFLEGAMPDALYQLAEEEPTNLPAVFPYPSAAINADGRVGVVYIKDFSTDGALGDAEVCFVEQTSPTQWGVEKRLTTDDRYQTVVSLAYLADGRPMVVWGENALAKSEADESMTFSEIVDRQDIWYTTRDADGTWADPQPLIADPPGNYHSDAGPVVAPAGSGALALWTRSVGDSALAEGSGEIYWSRFASGAWTSPLALTDNAVDDRAPVVCSAGGDSILALWLRGDSGTAGSPAILWSVWDGTSWSDAMSLRDVPGRKQDLTVARASNGNILTSWLEVASILDTASVDTTETGEAVPDTTLQYKLMTSSLPYGSNAWSAAEEAYVAPTLIEAPVMLVDRRNIGIITWRDCNEDVRGDLFVTLKHLDEPGAKWTLPRAITSDTLTDWMATAAVDKDNNLHVIDLKSDLDNPASQAVKSNFPGGLSLMSRGIENDLNVTSGLNFGFRPLSCDLRLAEGAVQLVTDDPAVGDVATIRACVKNIGDFNSTPTKVRFYDGAPDSGGTALPDGEVALPAIAPDDSATVEAPFSVTAGLHRLYAVADPGGTVAEQSESNNRSFVALMVGPSLAVDSLWVANPDPVPGTTDTLLALVRNLGGGPAEDFAVTFSGRAGALATVTNLQLDPRGETTLRVPFEATGGVDTLAAVVDPDSLRDDPDREDNRAEVVLRVLPDLTVPQDSTRYSIADTTFAAKIVNLSATPCAAFTVRFFLGNPQSDGVAFDSVRVESLESNGARWIEIPWCAPFGASAVYVVADADQDIEELDELNNMRYGYVIQSGVPQLVVVPGSIAWHVAKGPKFSLSAAIANLGTSPAFAVPVQFYRGNPDTGSTFIAGSTIPELGAGDSVTVTVPWEEPDPAINPIYVVVDAGNTVIESNESDNLAIGTFGDVLDASGSRVPARLALHAARPNPFTDMTAIRFDLPQQGRVRLQVFDIAGRRIRTLLNQDMAPGYHAVQWEGGSDSGLPMPAGIYFMRLETMGRTLEGKITRLK